MNIPQIAAVCHEINRAFCMAHGDPSQLPWAEAPEWQRVSAIQGVEFHLDNPNSQPRDSHDNWMREKLLEGWVYGHIKDPETKRHPCLIPFESLTVMQQTKDYLFLATVRSLEKHLTPARSRYIYDDTVNPPEALALSKAMTGTFGAPPPAPEGATWSTPEGTFTHVDGAAVKIGDPPSELDAWKVSPPPAEDWPYDPKFPGLSTPRNPQDPKFPDLG